MTHAQIECVYMDSMEPCSYHWRGFLLASVTYVSPIGAGPVSTLKFRSLDANAKSNSKLQGGEHNIMRRFEC